MDVGVIGVGAMGRNHVRVYSEMKEVGTLGVCDLNTSAARETGEMHGAVVFGSLDEMLNAVDAVSICVPTPHHYEVACRVLGHGVHALIEKPVCATSQEAEALIRDMPDDLIVGVGHIERFNPIMDEMRRIVSNPLYVEIKRHNPASRRVTGTSVVEDLMIHDIDLISHLFPARPSAIYAAGSDDVSSALFDCGGVPIYLSASRKSSKKIRMIYVEEEEFTVEGDFMTQELYIYRKPSEYDLENERYVQENIIEKVLVNKLEPLKRELQTFLRCVKTGTPFPVTPVQAMENLRICEEINRAMAARHPVTLK